jgi:hypothetical protein
MAANPFDSMAKAVFDTLAGVMGYDAVWTPSVGGAAQQARVFLNLPTQKRESFQYRDRYGDIEYDPNQYYLEFKRGDFLGLVEAVDAGKNEVVQIDITQSGTSVLQSFYVMKIHSMFDGNNFICPITPKV